MRTQIDSPEVQLNTFTKIRLKVAAIAGAGALVLSGCSLDSDLTAECDKDFEPIDIATTADLLEDNWMICG